MDTKITSLRNKFTLITNYFKILENYGDEIRSSNKSDEIEYLTKIIKKEEKKIIKELPKIVEIIKQIPDDAI